MRIPIRAGGPEDLWSREAGPSLRDHPRSSYPYGYRRTGRPVPGSTLPDRTNLAVQSAPDSREDEDTERVDEGAVREAGRVPIRNRDTARTEESGEDWKERYMRLRADFDNYKRHAEADRERLTGIGKARVLEDIFPLVEHMERAIRAAREANDRTGILEGIEMVYRELLKVLEKNGVKRIEAVGEPFDPEIHEAVAVTPHAEYPAGTVVEEVRAGFAKDDKLLRPASVVVSK